MKIRKNDNIMVLAGKDKGKIGIVERVFPIEKKIVVKGIALAKKHIKRSKKNPQGGIMDINQKIDASNAILMCPSCEKPTRISYATSDKGVKTRVCKKCKQTIEGGAV